jgi:hypothetical protein
MVRIRLPSKTLCDIVVMAAQLALKIESMRGRHVTVGKKSGMARPIATIFNKENNDSQGDVWKARQLKEYKRVNGLCYQCGEKYVPGHKCKTQGQPQLNYTAVEEGGDGGPILSDELLNFLDATSDRFEDEMVLSLNALSGAENPKCTHKCVRLRAMIKDQVILQLLDSGSSNTFISDLAATRINCVTQEIEPVSVKVANGHVISCVKKAVHLEWWSGGNTFHIDAFVLLVTTYDMVLGMD